MQRAIFPLFQLVFLSFPLLAQVAVGQWREHVPYNLGRAVADSDYHIWYASNEGLFRHSKYEGDIDRFSKVNGLSDIGFSAIAWSGKERTLVVAYSNANIDLIKEDGIVNIPDIRIKQILGSKAIHHIHVAGSVAYLSCGFGVVVLDIAKEEIRDTYIIGSGGGSITVHAFAASADRFYAFTEEGVLSAPRTGVNLNDFANWPRMAEFPEGIYTSGVFVNGRVVANRRTVTGDELYYLENGSVQPFPHGPSEAVNALGTAEDYLIVVRSLGSYQYTPDLQPYREVRFYQDGNFARPVQAVVDKDQTMWVADSWHGLVRHSSTGFITYVQANGPVAASSFGIDAWDGRVYVASGGYDGTWRKQYIPWGYFNYNGMEWKSVTAFDFPGTNGMSDFIRVRADRFDSRRVYVSTLGHGVLEYYDNEFVQAYNADNSTLAGQSLNPGIVMTSGLALDQNRTLWVGNFGGNRHLHAKTANGQWHGYSFPGVGTAEVGDIAIDQAGQKWVVLPRNGGLAVFHDNGTLDNTTDDQFKRMTGSAGNGNLASGNVLSVAADLNGQVWVGTDNGVSVFYSPQSVFSGGNFDSQRVLVEQDGYVQYLLDNQAVTAIAVDGANRKWLGTATAGVFLMSADGTKQIHHFNTTNSPLFSNGITAIGIDHLSGEVFFGTERGIISYRGTATYGEPQMTKELTYAFPNPVRPGYAGPIAIKGLVRDADVKITDTNGRTIFATKAQGGQAIWDGFSLSDARARAGIYMVFASDAEGQETIVTKIMIVN